MTPARPWATPAHSGVTLARNVGGPTPAQASGHPTLNDVPVQGPTDPGMREADCWFAQNRLPAHPACVDCKGPIPMWAQSKGLLGEWGGVAAPGFALAAAGDPEVWTKLTPEQQTWVRNVLVRLNTRIVQVTKTTCPTWGPAIPAAAGCFQAWFNATNPTTSGGGWTGGTRRLRTDGVFDRDTLDALITTRQIHAADFPILFPGSPPEAEKKGLSTGAMVGIGVVGATALGGVIYAATRKGGRRKARRRK